MSDIDWEKYKKSIIPNKNNKLFEESLRNPRIIKNREVTKLVRTQVLLSNLDNRNYKTSIANRKVQKHFRSEASIDLHYINGDLSNILETFCSKCILYGCHYATIITGKGKGILKNTVIMWFQQNSQFVSEYFEIKDMKKECGSLGIHLRYMNKIQNTQK